MVQWFRDRIGVVKYSDDLVLRQGPNYYDCSSAVFASLMHAGFMPHGHKGNTATLFGLEGHCSNVSHVRKSVLAISSSLEVRHLVVIMLVCLRATHVSFTVLITYMT